MRGLGSQRAPRTPQILQHLRKAPGQPPPRSLKRMWQGRGWKRQGPARALREGPSRKRWVPAEVLHQQKLAFLSFGAGRSSGTCLAWRAQGPPLSWHLRSLVEKGGSSQEGRLKGSLGWVTCMLEGAVADMPVNARLSGADAASIRFLKGSVCSLG